MKDNAKNIKNSNSEMIPIDVSKLTNLKYIKVIYVDANNNLHEICSEKQIISNDLIYIDCSSDNNIDIACPIGVVIKLITKEAIYFAKVVLSNITKKINKILLTVNAPKKAIRQQNRKHYRIDKERPCVLLFNDGENDCKTYIAQTVNLSKGGVLVSNVESILSDEPVTIKFSKNDSYNIAMFLEQDLNLKTYATIVRSEFVNNKYRYAFQFSKILKKSEPLFDKYLISEEFKILKNTKYK